MRSVERLLQVLESIPDSHAESRGFAYVAEVLRGSKAKAVWYNARVSLQLIAEDSKSPHFRELAAEAQHHMKNLYD